MVPSQHYGNIQLFLDCSGQRNSFRETLRRGAHADEVGATMQDVSGRGRDRDLDISQVFFQIGRNIPGSQRELVFFQLVFGQRRNEESNSHDSPPLPVFLHFNTGDSASFRVRHAQGLKGHIKPVVPQQETVRSFLDMLYREVFGQIVQIVCYFVVRIAVVMPHDTRQSPRRHHPHGLFRVVSDHLDLMSTVYEYEIDTPVEATVVIRQGVACELLDACSKDSSFENGELTPPVPEIPPLALIEGNGIRNRRLCRKVKSVDPSIAVRCHRYGCLAQTGPELENPLWSDNAHKAEQNRLLKDRCQ